MTSFSDLSAPHSPILVVDDREGPRFIKARLLRHAGFTVLEATSGQSALALVRQHMPDAVVLPVKLPDIDGLEACRLIKSDPETARTLVVQTSSGTSGARDRIQALDGGADSYLVEPVEPEELVSSLRALLRMRRAEEAYQRSEQAQRESANLFVQLADNLADALWVLDPAECRFLFVSRAFVTILGRPVETVLNDPLAWIEWIPEEDRQRVRVAYDAMLTDGRMDVSFPISRPDGEQREVHVRALPVSTPEGRMNRIAGICQDVTQQRRAERLLRDEDTRKDEFLAMLAHELRNPLAPMRSAADLLLHYSISREDAFRARDIIARQLHHLTHLVDDLLDISRFTQGRIALRDDRVELRTALNTAVEEVRPLIDAKQHSLRLRVPELPMMVRGDLVRLTQIFTNLIHNAANYTPDGGQIVVEATANDATIIIRVRDNGVGLSASALDTLLPPSGTPPMSESTATSNGSADAPADPIDSPPTKPAHAADPRVVATAQATGMGIGLSLVRKLVAMHHGQVYAQSGGSGTGAMFTVVLPAQPWKEFKPPASRAAPQPCAARRILLVDDNPDALLAMAMTLEALGHSVTTGTDGPSAIASASQLHPDVVLLDLGMPGMDGYETARRLRTLPEMRTVKLIALTGYSQPDDVRRTRAAGFDDHLVKPIDLETLSRVLDQAA